MSGLIQIKKKDFILLLIEEFGILLKMYGMIIAFLMRMLIILIIEIENEAIKQFSELLENYLLLMIQMIIGKQSVL
jgi:hypothetical protein